MSVIVSTKLSVDDYIELQKYCKKHDCSTYKALKGIVVTALINASETETNIKKEEKTDEPVREGIKIYRE